MSRVFISTSYGSAEHQELVHREDPAPGHGELAVEVRAAGVNPADVKRREGAFGTSGPLPVAMGLGAAGVVTAVGDGIEGFAVGDDVLQQRAPRPPAGTRTPTGDHDDLSDAGLTQPDDGGRPQWAL